MSDVDVFVYQKSNYRNRENRPPFLAVHRALQTSLQIHRWGSEATNGTLNGNIKLKFSSARVLMHDVHLGWCLIPSSFSYDWTSDL